MSDTDLDITDAEESPEPGLKLLLGQLATDTREFARAEVAWLKAEADTRANIAIPGLIMVAVAFALLFGLIVAGLIGAMIALSPVIGMGWAVLATLLVGGLFAFIAAKLGAARLVRAFKTERQ